MESMTNTFREVRAAYQQVRAEERHSITQRLRTAGYMTSTNANAGRGIAQYTNDGTLAPPHDLSHWMWVDAVRRDGLKIRVMLQSFDQDARSGNEHVLLDRLSIGSVPARIDNSRWLTDTGLELPLNAAMLDRLVGLLDALPR